VNPIVIEVEHLVKDYGSIVAVHDLSFRVGQGEIVGFLGPNGAGKTTTLRILAGFLGATSGRVRVAGLDIADEPLKARAKLGYMPEGAPLYPELKVREYLLYRARLKRVARSQHKAAIDRVLTLCAINDVTEVLIGQLSKGYRQRVALADALLGKPPLLILDEPTSGLDPNQIRDVRAVIRGLGQEHTILLSTHILSEVETTCDRALVISRGQLVAEGTLEQLRSRRESRSVKVLLRDPEGRAEALLRSSEAVEELTAVRRDGDLLALELRLRDADEAAGERLLRMLVENGVGVRELGPIKASLEQVFAELTQAEPRA
jgi:ABC-2 type transport system ATP-binding protein